MPRSARATRAFASVPPTLRRRRPPTSSITPTWRELPMADPSILLSQTLPTGQAFRWHWTGTHAHPPSPTGAADEWAGVITKTLFLLRQAPPHRTLWYSAHPPSAAADHALSDYLRTSTDLRPRYRACCDDASFRRVYPSFSGVRSLRQSPLECLFAFICSSNNNIKRISGMVKHLSTYGDYIATHAGARHHGFPCARVLAQVPEDNLREAGFGYRARYVVATARRLVELADEEGCEPEQLLLSWRELSREAVVEKLMSFDGVGRKVAGCVALMSLDQLGEVPVDTHVWKIAMRYMPHLTGKTLTERVYDAIGDFFRDKFGDDFAGVAHSVLFVAESSGKKVLEDCWKKGDEVDGDADTQRKSKSGTLQGVYKKSKRNRAVQPKEVPPVAVAPVPSAVRETEGQAS